MKRVIPLPAWTYTNTVRLFWEFLCNPKLAKLTSIVIILHYPAKTHHIGSKQMLPSAMSSDIISLTFVTVISIFPSFLMKSNLVIYILRVLVQLLLLFSLYSVLEHFGNFRRSIFHDFNGCIIVFIIVFISVVILKFIRDISDLANFITFSL